MLPLSSQHCHLAKKALVFRARQIKAGQPGVITARVDIHHPTSLRMGCADACSRMKAYLRQLGRGGLMGWSAHPPRYAVANIKEAHHDSSADLHLRIGLGKNWFHLVAMDRMGHVLAKQKLTRSQLAVH